MSSTVSADNTLQTTPNSSRTTTKRKIDDALYNLDQALRSSDDVQRPPAKKMRFPGSLYSTLAKYGIKTKARFTSSSKPADMSFISKNAPHLSAILSRAAAKKEREAQSEELSRTSVANLNTTTQQTTPVEYRPSSTTSFLSRLATFKLSTYSTKPSSIDAVAAARAGWINEGKERLLCGICKSSWMLASRDGLSRDAANTLVEKQRVQLVQMHKEGCPWKVRQCDNSIYCIPLKSPSALAMETKLNALEIDNKKVLEGVEIRHPLASSQVQALLSALSSVKRPWPPASDADQSTTEIRATQEEIAQAEPSQKAALTAVFGWSLVPPSIDSRPTTPSVAPSAACATSISHVPAMSSASRRTSWNSSSISEAGSPRLSRIPVPRTSSAVTPRLRRQETVQKRNDSLLHCSLCQRRIGIWAFKGNDETVCPASPSPGSPSPVIHTTSMLPPISASNNPPTPSVNGSSRLPLRRVSQGPMPKRQFDLLKEHRSYCPYVVRSTVVPSLTTLASSMAPPRSFSASHIVEPSRPSPTRSSSASSFNFSSLRGTPQSPEPGTTGGLGDPAAVEGWRAVLTMVMRTGLGRRQRQRALMNVQTARSSSDTGTSEARSEATPTSPTGIGAEQEQSDDPMEMDAIQAMVEDVKKHGGKDLIRYVKNLFK